MYVTFNTISQKNVAMLLVHKVNVEAIVSLHNKIGVMRDVCRCRESRHKFVTLRIYCSTIVTNKHGRYLEQHANVPYFV